MAIARVEQNCCRASRTAAMRKRVIPLTRGVLLTALLCMICWRSRAVHASPLEAPFCSAPAYRQFDFWLGEWGVFEESGSAQEARASVTSVQSNCALRELYQGADGSGGESLSMFDPRTGRWQQTWVSNRGQIVVLHGILEGQSMVLSGTDHGPSGKWLVKGVWTPEKTGVRETATRSSDGGKTWTPWFDLSFRPHLRRNESDTHSRSEEKRKAHASNARERQSLTCSTESPCVV